MRSIYDEPGLYLIRVVRGLTADWSDYLGGLTIAEAVASTETGAPIVELTGCLPDQAALCGVINMLHTYQCRLLRVEYLGPAGA